MATTKKSSWKTTTTGIASLVAAIAIAVIALFDNDPSTKVDIQSILTAVTALGIGIPSFLQGLFARDNNVSSEDAGAK